MRYEELPVTRHLNHEPLRARTLHVRWRFRADVFCRLSYDSIGQTKKVLRFSVGQHAATPSTPVADEHSLLSIRRVLRATSHPQVTVDSLGVVRLKGRGEKARRVRIADNSYVMSEAVSSHTVPKCSIALHCRT